MPEPGGPVTRETNLVGDEPKPGADFSEQVPFGEPTPSTFALEGVFSAD